MEEESCYTYVLYAPKDDRIYIGISSHPSNRFIAHNHPKNRGYTKKFQPWVLLHLEKFASKSSALQREQELKSHQGRDSIREMIKAVFPCLWPILFYKDKHVGLISGSRRTQVRVLSPLLPETPLHFWRGFLWYVGHSNNLAEWKSLYVPSW